MTADKKRQKTYTIVVHMADGVSLELAHMTYDDISNLATKMHSGGFYTRHNDGNDWVFVNVRRINYMVATPSAHT